MYSPSIHQVFPENSKLKLKVGFFFKIYKLFIKLTNWFVPNNVDEMEMFYMSVAGASSSDALDQYLV